MNLSPAFSSGIAPWSAPSPARWNGTARRRNGWSPEITESVLFDENVEALAVLQQLYQLASGWRSTISVPAIIPGATRCRFAFDKTD